MSAHVVTTAALHRPAVVPVAALHEARRLLTHPVMLVGWALWVGLAAAPVAVDVTVVQAWEIITIMPAFFPGVPAILAAHMLATRDLRAGLLDVADSGPTSREARVRAQCVASLAPFAVMVMGNLLLVAALSARGAYVETPGVWHLLQGPITVMGGCLLGTMVGVWAAAPVAPVLVMVALIAAHVVTQQYDALRLIGMNIGWADWGVYDGTVWVGQVAGSVLLHDLHLLALGGLAAAGALARVSPRRASWVGVGLLLLALAIVAGIAQYPS